jgi:mono/diheme cytochrome c family protein
MPRNVSVRSGRVLMMVGLITGLLIAGALFYLNTRPVDGTDVSDAALVERGRALYQTHCASCHGADLAGQPNWKERLPSGLLPAPPHDTSGHTWHHPDALLFKIVKDGGASVLLPGEASGMPAYGSFLSDEDIWAMLSYIKSTWPADIQQRQSDVSRQAAP